MKKRVKKKLSVERRELDWHKPCPWCLQALPIEKLKYKANKRLKHKELLLSFIDDHIMYSKVVCEHRKKDEDSFFLVNIKNFKLYPHELKKMILSGNYNLTKNIYGTKADDIKIKVNFYNKCSVCKTKIKKNKKAIFMNGSIYCGENCWQADTLIEEL